MPHTGGPNPRRNRSRDNQPSTKPGAIQVSGAGRLSRLGAGPGRLYDLAAAADGGVSFLSTTGGASATVWHENAGRLSVLASGPRTRLGLFAGRAGSATVTGASSSNPAALSAAGVRSVSDAGLPYGATGASLGGTVLLGDAGAAKTATGPVVGQAVPGSQLSVTVGRPGSAAQAEAVPLLGAGSGTRSAGGSSTPPASQPGSVAATSAIASFVPPGVAADVAAQAAAMQRSLGAGASLLRPAGSAKAQTGPAGLREQPAALSQPVAATADPQQPVCAVAPGDVNRQVMQPSPAQVDWASQMAERDLLTGGAYTRPANWDGYGLAAYAPNTDFPAIALDHPAGVSASTVPASVFNAIMAQESNYDQASWHAPSGNAGDPLIADYYGAQGDIVSIDYAAADCGYGLGQVTDGMRIGDTTLSASAQVKIAVDYQENIAAGLQILQGKWNQLYADGIIANNGDPSKLENWYFAIWAYNSGIQPEGTYDPTGCTPGPSCVGADGTWGLGWGNNPENPDYPPNRQPYLAYTYADAAHPGDWPYQERVMGWMGTPIVKYGVRAYSTPVYAAGQDWPQIPAFDTFCTTAGNDCNPAATNTSNPAAGHCTLDDYECWWHAPVTWIGNCATSCATSPYEYGAGSSEPANPNQNPIACTVDHSVVPPDAIVVDDETSPPVNLQGCDAPNWTEGGTFTLTPGVDAAGDPIGKIDIHQVGVGLGGHMWFSHTEDGSVPGEIDTGTWTPTLPSLQYYKIKVHFPSIGATATDVVYTIDPGGGAAPWKIRVNQDFGTDTWATIGTFAMQNGGSVSLTNQSAVTEPADAHDAYNYDVSWDAIAFVPLGGTPGTPIGGPPTVQDEPRGSNPSWLQCGCATRTAGDPVDTATGYFGQSFTDLSTPGRGLPLQITRSYAGAIADPDGPNKTLAVDGPFGWGWTFNYAMAAATDPTTGAVSITQEDGSQVTFTDTAGVYTPAAPRYDATLTKSGSTYTFVRSGRQFFTFDAATGHLAAETTLAGQAATPPYWTTLSYNGSGQLSTVTDPAGRTYTFTFTGGHITKVTDPAGREVDYGYDTAGDLTDVYGVATTRTPSPQTNDVQTYGYTTGHEIAWMRTPANYTAAGGPGPGATAMTYDGTDRVLTQTDPDGNTTTFAYGPSTSPTLQAGQTLVTDPAGHETLDAYTEGLLTSQTRGYGTADSGTWSYTYDPLTLGVSTESDPDGHTRTFAYDDHGNRIFASDPLGYATLWTYDGLGDVLTTVDPTGTETINGYDQAGHTPTAGATYGDLTSSTVTTAGADPVTAPAGAARTTNFYYTDTAHPADLTKSVDPAGNATESPRVWWRV